MHVQYKSDKEYLVLAYEAAMRSPDPSTQNGAVIAYSEYCDSGGRELNTPAYVSACNQFPQGVRYLPERMERPLKYSFIEHAERGVIYEAAKKGIELEGRTIFVPWAACSDCARAIICSGIGKVVTHKRMMDATPEHWKESIKFAFEMFFEAKIEVVMFEDELPEAPMIRFNGQLWQP